MLMLFVSVGFSFCCLCYCFTEILFNVTISLFFSYIHGLLAFFLLGTGISRIEAEELRERCLSFLMEQLKVLVGAFRRVLVHLNKWSFSFCE